MIHRFGIVAMSIWASLAAYRSANDFDAGQDAVALPAPEMAKIDSVGVAPFLLAKFETTWAQYMGSVREASCPMPQNGWRKPIATGVKNLADNYPVTGVTTSAIDCYINWFNRRTGKRYRLPTPAEWRAAAARVTAVPRSWNSQERGRTAAERGADPREAVRAGIVRRVGQSEPSPDGVFDLEGNANEFTSARRPGKRSDYACRELGAAFCAEALIVVHPGAENPDDPRRDVWGFQGMPYIFSGFRLAADL